MNYFVCVAYVDKALCLLMWVRSSSPTGRQCLNTTHTRPHEKCYSFTPSMPIVFTPSLPILQLHLAVHIRDALSCRVVRPMSLQLRHARSKVLAATSSSKITTQHHSITTHILL